MATEFTEENFSILFSEQNKLVEVRYQGLNATNLATLSGRVDTLESELDAALASSSGSIGTISTDLNSLTTLVSALSGTVNSNNLDRIAGDELNATDILTRHNTAMAAITAETNARGAALLQEAADRGAAISFATGTIITDVANLAITVDGLAATVGGHTASIISVESALATETSTRASQYSALQADFGDTNAAILSESVARADGDDALASQIDIIAASSGTNVFTQPNEPLSGMIAGDIWYDTDDGNKPYRYDGVAWVDVTDVRITNNATAISNEIIARTSGDSANATSISTLTSTVNLKGRVFAQASAPVSDGSYTLVAGDIWVDTDSVPANLMYRWSGSAWVDINNSDIAQNKADITQVANTAADDTQAVANTVSTLSAVVNVKTRTFSQASAPVSDGSYTLVVGDLWIDTDSVPANKLHRWNGTSWVETRDAGIEQARGEVVTEAGVRASAVSGIEAKYGVRVNANGHVAGFGLIAYAPTDLASGYSEFTIDATRFKVFNGSSGVAPFLVEGGVVKMRNVLIESAQISSLSITQVTTGTIGAPFLANTAGSIMFGKYSYGSATAGMWFGYNSGYYRFDIGTSTQYIRWTGTSLDLYGATITLAGAGGYTRYLGVDVASTYIDWYGTGAVTDANARFFIKKDGSAMFTGRLRGEFEPKAWASIYGEVGAVAVRDCFNVSSVQRISTGYYRIWFHTALPNANYACVTGGSDPAKLVVITVAVQATTYVDIQTNKRGDGGSIDVSLLNFVIFGSNVPPANGGTNPVYNDDIYYGGTWGGGLIP